MSRFALALTLILSSAAAFAAPENIALGRPYELNARATYALTTDPGDATQLTDGVRQTLKAGDFWTRKETVGWTVGEFPSVRFVTVDLGKDEPISGFGWNYAAGRAGVLWPEFVNVYVSNDRKTWRFAGDLFAASAAEHGAPPRDGYAVVFAQSEKMPCHGRYVRFLVRGTGYLFVDEVEVYRGPAANLVETGAEETTDDPIVHYAQYHVAKDFSRDADALNASVRGLSPAARDEALAALYRVNAVIARARGLSRPFFWATDRWANNGLLDLPAAPSAVRAPAPLEMMRGETRSLAVSLTNPTDAPLETEVVVEGFPKTAAVALREVVHTSVKDGRRVAGLLLPNDAGARLRVSVLPGTTKQLYLSFDRPTASAGRYEGRLVAAGAEIPVVLRLSSLVFPKRPRMHVGGWDYTNNGNGNYKAPKNLRAKLARMGEMFTDTPWANAAVLPSGAVFAADGTLDASKPLNFSAWNEWTGHWGDQARQYCVYVDAGRQFGGEKMGTPRFARMLSTYMRAWYDGIRAKLNGRRVLLLLVDEPNNPEMTDRILVWARAIRAGAPEFAIFEDVNYHNVADVSSELLDVVDVFCPPTPGVTARRQEGFYASLGRKGKEVWLYSCNGPSRTFDPIGYYRAQAWHAWNAGACGTFFWAFGCGGGLGNSFRPFEQPGTEYSPFFVSPTDAFRAKQSEAILESVEDYEYLALLKDRIAALKKAGRPTAELEKLLAEAPAHALAGIDPKAKDRYDWMTPHVHGAMDEVRVEILRALERAGE